MFKHSIEDNAPSINDRAIQANIKTSLKAEKCAKLDTLVIGTAVAKL